MADETSETDSNSPGVVFREAAPIPTVEEAREAVLKSRSEQTKEMTTEVKPAPKTPPLSLYKHIRGRPYSSDYFGLGPHWERWNLPKEIESIEGFVKEEIKKFGLNDSVESYEEIVEALEQRIGKRPTERVWHKLDRLVSYIRAVNSERKWAARKIFLEKGLNGETR